MLLELRYEMHEKEFGHDIMCDSLVEHLLILLERHLNLNTMAGNANIQQVIRYINLHYTENLTLDFCVTVFISASFICPEVLKMQQERAYISMFWKNG